MHKVFVGIGSNLGDKKSYCKRALAFLNILPQTKIKRCSSFYLTEPVKEKNQPWFLNLVVLLQTDLGYQQLFFWLKHIEHILGRFPTWEKGPRIIDLDLLLYDDLIINSPNLIIPHPQFHKRGFVLAPLAEIAQEEIHPLLKQSFKQLWANHKFKEWVIRLK
ncbi:MAG TPA: 2-amino-4-hydroxy-6-hydroxymethyldihydropteridine diphosphokinase [Candidatus Desulfofervidus auxilii]|uniref:2-amino-4-hydroxy-6-hydroxymethyldihydropteridine pyrophosphokinase n=1 Tax=Desulfofervidus auxilii TaxID=1621989 RepID=A0A7C1VY21_DESA2|nr:2-amino-4-hydroxy-6-hydroxymethyldihydropteridine diphosphokinase [Candidatus Desulfofervidus auxilii]